MKLSVCCTVFILICQFEMAITTPKYTFWENLSKQANTLSHGLMVANKMRGRFRQAYVAFTAYPSSNRGYRSGQKVWFNNKLLNAGNAFNGYDFRAPHAGIYAFNWNIRPGPSNKRAYTSLRVNGYTKMYSRCYTGTTSYSDACSQHVLLQLGRNDKVAIYCDYTYSYIEGSFSSFSGWEL